jgi:hypothetical protein
MASSSLEFDIRDNSTFKAVRGISTQPEMTTIKQKKHPDSVFLPY